MIKPWYLYKMSATEKIVDVEEHKKVTWEVIAFPGMYARHTYHVEDLGNGRTQFGSWAHVRISRRSGYRSRLIRTCNWTVASYPAECT